MDSLETWIRKVLSSIGYQRGFAHTEFMITGDGFEVIEINPRLGGVQIGEALCRSFGINIYESWVEMALNKRPELMDMHLRDKKGIGQLIVYAEQSGIFSHIEGLDRLVNHPGALCSTQRQLRENVSILLMISERASVFCLLKGIHQK